MARHEPGTNFPRKGFVQKPVERYFFTLGYEQESHTDAWTHPVSKKRWIVEVKGETINAEIDFRAGLKHLLRAAEGPTTYYAMAVPATAGFLAQVKRVTVEARKMLSLYWLLVDEIGAVKLVGPSESVGV
jgi:hypothetical protein